MRSLPFFALALLILPTGCATESTPDGDAGRDAASFDGGGRDTSASCTSSTTCDDGLYCNGNETCVSGTCTRGTPPSCDDGIACTIDRCVESRRVCENPAPDHDGDGFADMACTDHGGVPLGTDCADDDAARHPGGTEMCDATGHDEDCNPATYGAVDVDGDGHNDAMCCNTGGLCGDDCDDHNPAVSPADTEVCNGRDDDCDIHIDEGLPLVPYSPDCDMDGYGNAMVTPMMACTIPVAAPCASGGQWVTMAGDCADTDSARHVGATEACNNIDDDCDTRVDDIIDGNVICHAMQTQACNTTCGLVGVQTCSATCLGYDAACIATEICNGCDDDADGSVDDGFACARGTSEPCTVPTCGTTGTRVCSATCGWGTCAASEACNYCDDDGDGNYFEERPLATVTGNAQISGCTGGSTGAMFGTHTACGPDMFTGGQDLYATLIDGTGNNQAGALWFDPSNWSQGWGPIDVTIDLEVTAVSAGGAAEQPLGGWAVLIGHGGTLGVGTPQDRGIPRTISGVAASWYWSQFDHCSSGTPVPSNGDSVRFERLASGGIGGVRSTTGGTMSTCYSGEGILGGSPSLDGPASGTIVERIQLRYTPDDPTTAAVNEELVRIIASAPAGSGGITYSYVPSNDLPLGSGPLRIGVTAGTYTQSGFTGGPPASLVFGVPVRARVHLWTQHYPSGGNPNRFDYWAPITRASICP